MEEIKEMVEDYFGVITDHSPGGIEKSMENLSQDIRRQKPKFEPVSFGLQVRILKLEPICALRTQRLAV